MQNTIISKLNIGQLGVLDLNIPIYTIGSGKPVIGITCSVHGDETAGLFIVARMLEILKSNHKTNGTIHIISAANPIAQLENKRVTSFDWKDLNRVGRGNPDGTLTEKIGFHLFKFLSTCDLVVNIHEFEMYSPVTAVFMNAGSTEVRLKSLTAIKVFSPTLIWAIDTAQNTDKDYGATLDTALAESGIPNFPIETTQLKLLTSDEIERTALGLYRVISQTTEVLETKFSAIEDLPLTLTRQAVTTRDAGLWYPNESLMMKEVKKAERIGALKVLPIFHEQTVEAHTSGVLVQYRQRSFVNTGDSIYSIGHSAAHLMTPYI